jgi:phosphate transport system protein
MATLKIAYLSVGNFKPVLKVEIKDETQTPDGKIRVSVIDPPSIYGKEIDPVLRGLISKMSEQAEQLYQSAINSFAENDAATAAAIEDMDSFLDALHRQFIQAIFETHARERMDLQLAVQLAIVARFYERIGDHAVNVGERVQFALTGWKPELRAIERQRQRDATGEFPMTQG